ncbi:hypothetical protein [Microterricola pindariensis]|nr:hypothetical protein [Microterricola pindariensis]
MADKSPKANNAKKAPQASLKDKRAAKREVKADTGFLKQRKGH